MNRQPNARNQQYAQVNEEAIPDMDNRGIGKEKGAPVHTKKSKLRALALGICLLVMLTLRGIAAKALDNINNDTLTVIKTNSADTSFSGDIRQAAIDVDLYKIYNAVPSTKYEIYDYENIEGVDLKPLADYKGTDGQVDWEALATDAQKLLDDGKLTRTTYGTIPANADSGDITGLTDGLYLVVAHPTTTSIYEYTFSPAVAAVPSKNDANGDGIISTSFDDGEWQATGKITLKPKRLPLYGALEITKIITEPDPQEALFTFHIVGDTPQGEGYDNYASVTIKPNAEKEEDRTKGSVIVDHIPAGTVVTVTEEYAAGRYDIGTVSIDDGTSVIVADNEDGTHNLIHFSCKNTRKGDSYGGHGVQNNFRYDNAYQEWPWTPTPADKAPDYKPANE